MTPLTLPPGFEDLEAHAADWALPSEEARYNRRVATPLPDLQRFYDGVFPRLDAVMRFLAGHPADASQAAPPVQRLFHLALACVEASTPIELGWRSADLDDAFPARRIEYLGPSCLAD